MSTGKLFIVIFLSAVIGGTVAVMGLNSLVIGKVIDKIHSSSPDSKNVNESNSQIQGAAGTQVKFAGASAAGITRDSEEEIVEKIYEALSPSVVHITTVRYAYDFWVGALVPQKGTGSGVIVDKDGHILTNHHVIEPALSRNGEIFVTFADGEIEEATVIGFDEISDLAVVKLKNKPSKTLPNATLGDSDKVKVGSRAIVIGNPFGLSGTCTVGVISALNRTVYVDNQELEGMIQTDATINPGNSGGPIINSSGEVIGIASTMLTQSGGSEGIGFAIPINIIKKIMQDLISFGKVRRPYIGIKTFPVVATLAAYLNLPVNEGLLVQQVEFNSPASKAGLKGGEQAVAFRQFKIYIGGDIITHLNGEKVTNPLEFDKAIRKMEIGDKVVLDIIRNNKKMKIEVTLEVRLQ
jgi:S1-C subfamily serine protease